MSGIKSFVMDKVTSQGVTLIALTIGVLIAFTLALMTAGLDTAVEVFKTLSPFVTVIVVYFGLQARGSESINERLTELLVNNEEKLKFLIDRIAKKDELKHEIVQEILQKIKEGPD